MSKVRWGFYLQLAILFGAIGLLLWLSRFYPLLEDCVDLGGVSRTGAVVGKPLIGNELRLPDGSARPLEDALPAA